MNFNKEKIYFYKEKILKNPNYLLDLIDNINDNNVNDFFKIFLNQYEFTEKKKYKDIICIFLQKLLLEKTFKNYDFLNNLYYFLRYNKNEIDINVFSVDNFIKLLDNFTVTHLIFDFTKYKKYDIKIYYVLKKIIYQKNYFYYNEIPYFKSLIMLIDFFIKNIKEEDKNKIFPVLGLFLIKNNYKPSLDEVHQFIKNYDRFDKNYYNYIYDYLEIKINQNNNYFIDVDYLLDNCNCSLTKETLKVLCDKKPLIHSKYIQILKDKFGIVQEYSNYILLLPDCDVELEKCILNKKNPSSSAIKLFYINQILSQIDYSHCNNYNKHEIVNKYKKHEILNKYDLKSNLYKDIDKTMINTTTISSPFLNASKPINFCRKYKTKEIDPTFYDLYDTYSYVAKKISILHLLKKYENKDTTKEIDSIIKRFENGETFVKERKLYIKPVYNRLIPDHFLKKKKLNEKDFLRTLKHDNFYLFLVAINKVDYPIDLDILLYRIPNQQIKYYLKLILLQKYENIKTDHIIDFIHQEFLYNKN
tara:strand:- start:10355 stop:11944 length:1590 start_codon:yes stop_codon:yes gene_type:complete